jgi:hypothetical protein
VRCPTSIPSFNSSAWLLGAPQRSLALKRLSLVCRPHERRCFVCPPGLLDVRFYLCQQLTELATGLEIGELGSRSGAVKASPAVPSKTNIDRDRDYLPQ